MCILIGGKKYSLNVSISKAYIGRGGEAEVYKIDSQSLAKIYHEKELQDPLRGRERRLKVLALCNSYANNVTYLGSDNFAFPRLPAYKSKKELDLLCGFLMKFFEDCPTFDDIGFDLSMQKFKSSGSVALDDDKAVKLIYNTFNVVDKLHTARVILGDINPSNLLYNPKSNDPIIIDIDSAQIGQFKCLVCSPEYIDPLIQQQGKNITYSEENDIFSIACICFQLLIGKNPFWVLTDPIPPPSPNKREVYNKEHGISILRFFHTNTSILGGIKCLDNPVNKGIKLRISSIKSSYPKLYDYFVSIFLDSRRISLMQTLARHDPRHPAYKFYSVYSQIDFAKVLREIIAERRKPKIIQPLPTAPSVVGTFAIPDLGFSEVLRQLVTSHTSSASTVVTQTKTPDPNKLMLFLENYAVDISDLIDSAFLAEDEDEVDTYWEY